ncbi:putative ribonuclease H-like domain-containing protein [Tanacetum coccineum]
MTLSTECYNWSDMAEEQVQTNMALMAFSDFEVYNDKSCSKSCLTNYETLKKQYDDLIVKIHESEFKEATYKRGLATVEDQLVTFRKNKQEKEGIDFKIAKFDNASKCLDQLLESQITDKSKKGLGYHVVALPHPLSLNAPTKLDLSYSGLDEFKELEFNEYSPRDTVLKSTIDCDKESDNSKENTDDSLEKEQVSDNKNSSIESSPNVVKETVFHAGKKVEFVKPKNNEKPVKRLVSFDYMKINCPYHQRKKMMTGKYYNRVDSDYYAKTSHTTTHTNMTLRAVLLKSGLNPISTVRHGNPQLNDKGAYGGRIYGKGTLKTDNLDFNDVYFVKELKFNLFSVSQMCDIKNYVLFTDTECLILSPNFKLPDENHILLKIPREDNMYSFDMKNIIPKESLTCLGSNIEPLVFFLTTKDETSEILKNFIKEIENLVDKKVKIIRCDNGTEFKNKVMDDFCREKGIRREYSVARTPQQNGVAERRNRTLIKAARTMLADSKLPTTFWAEAVSTTCYVQNRVLIVKPHNKTPYELFRGFKPALGFMRPFGCHVTILNTLDNLSKFDGKSDEGFFVGYSLSSKAFRVYNTRTKKVEENLHVRFLKNKPMLDGNGPKWLFDIDSLTQSINYTPVTAGTITNEFIEASYFDSPSTDVGNDEPKSTVDAPNPTKVNADGQQVNTASPEVNIVVSPVNIASPKDMLGASPSLEATHIEFFSDEDEPDVELGKILNSYAVPTPPNIRIHKDHPLENMIGDVQSYVHTRGMKRSTSKQGFLSAVYEEKTYADLYTLIRIEAIRLFLAYASFMGFIVYQIDVKSAFLYGTIENEVYVYQPLGFEDPDYLDKVYKVVKALIDQTLFIKKQKGDILLVQVYVDDIIFGSTKKELCTEFEKLMKDKFQMISMGELTFFLGLQVKQKTNGIFICQDKYVVEILRKYNYTDVKTASTPFDLEKPLVKDGDADDVYVHLYRSMIGSLMYLTASRPDIMFAVCACARFQVTPKTSHLLAVKRIFRYLKGKPTLGLRYSRNSIFELVVYSDSDYAGATQDRKSTTGGCQTLRYLSLVVPLKKVGDEAVRKELGDRMERAATTASSLEVEQVPLYHIGDVDAQTRFEAASKSLMTHLSQELTLLEVGRTA